MAGLKNRESPRKMKRQDVVERAGHTNRERGIKKMWSAIENTIGSCSD